MASLVLVTSRYVIDEGFPDGRVMVADRLECGHEIWYSVTNGGTYPSATRRRCPTCEGLAVPGEPPVKIVLNR